LPRAISFPADTLFAEILFSAARPFTYAASPETLSR
jgi:hypothetical protein